jgi:putative spermidine/putrescine transport system permease protein
LGGVRDTTFVMLIYQNVNESHDWNTAAAMAMLLLAATVVLALMSRWLLARERTAAPRLWQHWLFLALVALATALQRSSAGKPKQPRRPLASAPVHEGLRSVRTVGLIFLVLSVLPLLVLIPMSLTDSAFISFPPPAYSIRWYLNFLDRRDWYMPAVRSFLIAAAVMGLSTFLGVCAALAVSRLQKGTAIAYAIILSPMVVPTVVFALGLYLSFAKVGLIGTYAGIALGHTILAVPYVFIVMNSAFAKVDISFENAAQVLGAGPIRAFVATTLPLIAPAILSAALFAFLISFDDIIISLFISDAQTTTLPKRMWEGIRFEIDPTSVAVSVILLSGSLLVVGIAEFVRSHVQRLQRSSRAIEYFG